MRERREKKREAHAHVWVGGWMEEGGQRLYEREKEGSTRSQPNTYLPGCLSPVGRLPTAPAKKQASPILHSPVHVYI